MSDHIRERVQFGFAFETVRKIIEEQEAAKRNPPDLLFSNMEESVFSGLWLPKAIMDPWIPFPQVPVGLYASITRAWGAGIPASYPWIDEQPAPPPSEPAFDVDMMEPLIGWRAWRAVGRKGQVLSSINSPTIWHPLKPLEAFCRRADDGTGHKHGPDVPRFHCTCGVYALDKEPAYEDDMIVGQVYGWGRYVRADLGWRSQFAYPKSFHLMMQQMHYMDALKQFRVPITVWEKTPRYDPTEDGYGTYRGASSHGSIGADGDSSTTED